MLFRVFDIVFSSLVLFCSLPVFALIAYAIALDSGRPVFFTQERVGKNGNLFTMLKFRTMKKMPGTCITVQHDARITRVGRFLRRVNVDELPQFINIFRGDLGVVGPRPEVPQMAERYHPHLRGIFSFKPGFTSMATVKFINEEEFITGNNAEEYYIRSIVPQKVSCDLEYFGSQRTFFRDILIILRTVGKTFVGTPRQRYDA